MKITRCLLAGLVALSFTACGGDDDDDTTADAATTIDGSVTTIDANRIDGGSTTVDGAAATCSVDESFGALGETAGEVLSEDPTQAIIWYTNLAEGTLPDELDIELWAGTGLLTDGIATGTYDLSEETSYATCGVCVVIYGDVDWDAGEYANFYMATSGTVTLTSVEGQLVGTLSNAAFSEFTVDWETYESTEVTNGCTSAITGLSFSGALPVVTVDAGVPTVDAGVPTVDAAP